MDRVKVSCLLSDSLRVVNAFVFMYFLLITVENGAAYCVHQQC
jgi:hypothetical protein